MLDNEKKKPVGWSNTPIEHPTSFGVTSGGRDDGIKSKLVNLISSVRTLMRSMYSFPLLAGRGTSWLAGRQAGRLTRVSIFLVPLIVINTLVIVYELVLG